MEKLRFCKRCLLADLGESALLRSIQEYISLLPPEQRAGSQTVERRLQLCRGCPRLQNGMCSLCGCFVEARASKAGQRCPDTPPRWVGEKLEENAE